MKKSKTAFGLMVMVFAAAVAAAPMSASVASSNLFERGEGLGDLFVLDELFSGTLNSRILSDNNHTDLGDLFILDQLFPVEEAAAQISLAQQLSGRIVLQVEENGEAWYIDPVSLNRVSLGNPNSAFSYMSSVAQGINNADFDSFAGTAPARLAGRFLLKTEDNGTIYYVNPVSRGLIAVVGPGGAASVIENTGLGITNNDLGQIPIAP